MSTPETRVNALKKVRWPDLHVTKPEDRQALAYAQMQLLTGDSDAALYAITHLAHKYASAEDADTYIQACIDAAQKATEAADSQLILTGNTHGNPLPRHRA